MHHNNYPKGSEWNKWDMHVHTPSSVLANEFGDNWDKYIKEQGSAHRRQVKKTNAYTCFRV